MIPGQGICTDGLCSQYIKLNISHIGLGHLITE